MKKLIIKGAREHNLKDIDVELPRDKLIVISGLSGSGKSSLAFDTIYAEGQRRYVESLSAYARQFLGRMEKPDIDYIEGLSPAIAIEQKSTHRNPRSTVGTVTEIYDYLRLLFARIGRPHCPKCQIPINEQSVDQIIDSALNAPDGTRIMVLAPLIKERKTEGQKLFDDAQNGGFARVRVNGEIFALEETIRLDKKKKHTIEIVVDRIKLTRESRKRLADSIETALEVTNGQVIIAHIGDDGNTEREDFFSERNSCSECGYSIAELQPRLFSFNSPFGACPECDGLGMTLEFDRKLILPDDSLTIREGALKPYSMSGAWNRATLTSLSKHFGFSLDIAFKTLPASVKKIIFEGSDEVIAFSYKNKEKTSSYNYKSTFRGLLEDLKKRYRESDSENVRKWLEAFMSRKPCSLCEGRRLNPDALSVLIDGQNIHDATVATIKDARRYFLELNLNETERHISQQIIKEINERLGFLESVGLEYLTLHREAATLSGGEAQRIRLATQIGSSLTGVLYVLDEPSIGLHQRDNQRLIDTLIRLRNLGNTLIVVEHDEQTLKTADHIVDLGPRAGIYGGTVTAEGTPEEVMAVEESLTGQFLKGTLTIDVPKKRRRGNGKSLSITNAAEHNLKGINVKILLETFTVITGVSGSGKSTLLSDILYPALHNVLSKGNALPVGKFSKITGTGELDRVILIDQSPIGRTPRSNPATYVGLFTPIRELFATLPDSKARGFKAGRFSFNVKGGRCESCEGAGTRKIEMHFLPDIYVTCDVCNGKRFNKETLDIRYKGKNIHDVLNMSVSEAVEFFSAVPVIHRKLQTLMDVGMDYVKLGQSALTLSGGEAQRIKLSLELSKVSHGKTLYVIDEPTTGLHFADVKKLLEVLQALVDKGNTITMIEHNLDVIKQADYLIDLGPEGGDGGGCIVAQGTPEKVVKSEDSYTGHFLREVLEKK